MDWALLIPIVAIMMGGFIAVASILTAHQRKMAELVRKDRPDSEVLNELRSLRGEFADVRDRVNQQTLALEEPTASTSRQVDRPPDIPQRLSD